jgi:hypothetical protein
MGDEGMEGGLMFEPAPDLNDTELSPRPGTRSSSCQFSNRAVRDLR